MAKEKLDSNASNTYEMIVCQFICSCASCLQQLFHVAYVLIKFANSPRPDLWVLERSVDFGKTYQPWQFFACEYTINMHVTCNASLLLSTSQATRAFLYEHKSRLRTVMVPLFLYQSCSIAYFESLLRGGEPLPAWNYQHPVMLKNESDCEMT